jgi:outer membrane protein assembly factor BamB
MEKREAQRKLESHRRQSWLVVGLLCLPAISVHAQVTQQWVRRYNGPSNGRASANAIAIDGAGNAYVTGRTRGSTRFDYDTVAYDASGNLLWEAAYHSPFGDSEARAIAIDGAGNVYVTGYSHDSTGQSDFATVAYDASGNQSWVARWPGGAFASAIAVDGAGHVYVTGYVPEIFGGDWYATVAYNATNGSELWEKVYYDGDGEGTHHRANAIAVDGDGHVYVTGYSTDDVTGGTSYATVAYDAITGTQLWVARFSGFGLSNVATAIAVDAAGHVYVTGFSFYRIRFQTGYQYVTLAYDSSGNQLWAAGYLGPQNDNRAVAIAVDGAGIVYVTGYSDGGATGYDYATLAYDSNSGNQLWAARYNGPGNSGDFADAIAADGVGKVYVTGYSWRGATGYDYATLAYDSNSGNQLWLARYNGGNGSDFGTAIAVDGAGDVYVTGDSSNGGTTDYAYATIKYSQP